MKASTLARIELRKAQEALTEALRASDTVRAESNARLEADILAARRAHAARIRAQEELVEERRQACRTAKADLDRLTGRVADPPGFDAARVCRMHPLKGVYVRSAEPAAHYHKNTRGDAFDPCDGTLVDRPSLRVSA